MIYTCFLNIKDSVKQIDKAVHKDLKFLVQWLNANRISLNIAKTLKLLSLEERKSNLWKKT